MSDLTGALGQAFGADRVKRDASLAPFTTFKVGGPADVLIETQNADEIVQAVKLAHSAGVKVTMLGGGSNVLIADRGIRGLVIRTRGGEVKPIGDRLVRADAAVTINGLVRWTINRGYAGLEAWAGTPGTVGGVARRPHPPGPTDVPRPSLERYPYAHCELDFETPLELLVATVLSAQTTDVMVNQVTPTLFARYPPPRRSPGPTATSWRP